MLQIASYYGSSRNSQLQPLFFVEAKYIISTNTIKEAVWLQTLLKKLDFIQATAIIIYVDNSGCIALTYNPVTHSCTKYIDIHHYFIHEHIKHDECNFTTSPQKIYQLIYSQSLFIVILSSNFVCIQVFYLLSDISLSRSVKKNIQLNVCVLSSHRLIFYS